MDLEEAADLGADRVAVRSIRRYEGDDCDHTVTSEHLAQETDTTHVLGSILAAEAKIARQCLADRVAVDDLDIPPARSDALGEGIRERGLA